jgi:hypothetical protein
LLGYIYIFCKKSSNILLNFLEVIFSNLGLIPYNVVNMKIHIQFGLFIFWLKILFLICTMFMPKYSYKIFIHINYKYFIFNCLMQIFFTIKRLIPKIIYFRIKSIPTLINLLITTLIMRLIKSIKRLVHKIALSIFSVYTPFTHGTGNISSYTANIRIKKRKFWLNFLFGIRGKSNMRQSDDRGFFNLRVTDEEIYLILILCLYITSMKKTVMTLNALIYGLIFLLPPILLFFLGP